MNAKYSPSTKGVYPLSVFRSFPADAIDITDNLYAKFKDGEISRLGVVNGVVVEYVEPALSLDDLKTSKRAEIKSSCHSAIISGIDHDALGAMHHYPTTETDQVNLNGLVTKSVLLLSEGAPYKFWCADANGIWNRRDHTAEQIQAVGLAIAAHVISLQDIYESKLAAINAAINETQLNLITW